MTGAARCPVCKGAGSIEVRGACRSGVDDTDRPCTDCHGTGARRPADRQAS